MNCYPGQFSSLFVNGADIYCVDNRGHTPLSYLNSRIDLFGSTLLPAYQKHQEALKGTAEALPTLFSDERCVFVSPDGEDTNVGSLNSPFRTIAAALDVVGPGDSVIVRGGHHYCLRTIHVKRSGILGKPIRIVGYPGERPILDFSKTKGYAFLVEGSYWHFKNLSITGVEFGMFLNGEGSHHNILEQLIICKNEQGVKLLTVMQGAAYNVIFNCDVYDNFDFNGHGADGDGFGVLYSNGPGNILIGNRAWNNSDDGYDCWSSDNAVRFERCYAWDNGDNIWNMPMFGGDANGFKCSGAARHVYIGCVAWGHNNRGFQLAGNEKGVVLHNCIAWNNERNYGFDWSGWPELGRKGSIFINNISHEGNAEDTFHAKAENRNNNWNPSTNVTLTEKDFLSLDDSAMAAPRNPDGSIPYNNFLRLARGSAAIDAGSDVNTPYVGKAPDIGAFEYDSNATVGNYVKMLHQAVRNHDVTEINQLLAEGEGINDKDWLGYTPLHWAVYFGYADLIELLISKGADPDIQSDTGRYSLEIAHGMAYPELEALLRKLGAKEPHK